MVEYSPEMNFGVISGEKNGLFADNAAEAMRDEDQRTGWCIAGCPVRRQVIDEVRGMIYETIRRGNRSSHDICVITVGENPGLGKLGWEKSFWPRYRLPVCSPCAVSIARQAVHEADVDFGIGTFVPHFHSLGEGLVRGILARWLRMLCL